MDDVLPPSALLSWNVDLTVCDLDKELRVFKAKHTAEFSAQVKGQSHQHTQTLSLSLSLSLFPVAWRQCCDGFLEERLQGFHVSECDFNTGPT